jgi:hypothetical protein
MQSRRGKETKEDNDGDDDDDTQMPELIKLAAD